MHVWAGCGDGRVSSIADTSRGVSPVASLPFVARPRTSYWSVGTRRIRAGFGEIGAITAVPVCPIALSSSRVSSGNSMSSSSKVCVPDEDVLGFLRSSEKKEQVNI